MKHRNKSASPCELACPHLSDHPTQKAKSQRSGPAYSLNGLRPKRINHGRSVVCSDHHTGAAFLTLLSHFCLSIPPAPKPDDRTNSSIGERCTSVATAFPSPGGEGQGEGVLPQPLFTPDFPTRNEFLKLNLAAIFNLQPSAVSLPP